MSAHALAAHLRRYPVWYAVGAVWLVAMLALPIVRGTALADVFDGAGTAAGPVGPDVTQVDGADGVTIGPDGTPITTSDAGTAGGDPAGTTGPAEDDDEEEELSLVPPELVDLVFDALPPVAVPALPAEVLPVAAAVAPLAATGCSGIGLVGVVVAVAAQTAEGVPIERLLPYLAPVSTACASFPIPKVHTVCAADEPFVTDLGGLTTSPPPLGLGIDQLEAFEQLLTSSFGVAVPSVSQSLREQLDCELVE